MESIILYIAIALGALVVGLLLGSLLGRGKNKERIESANKEAKDILRKTELEAEALKKEKMFFCWHLYGTNQSGWEIS